MSYLCVQGITAGYGRQNIIENISFTLKAGCLLGIIGGGAIIIAVVMAISGFGFRYDAGSEADSAASGGFPGGAPKD